MSAQHTYTNGFYLTAVKPITKGDMVQLCKDLSSRHEATGLKFQPEAITEGGIVYKFPDNSPHGEYKTIRMYFNRPTIKRNKSFILFDHLDAYRVSQKHLQKLGVDHLVNKNKHFHWPCVPVNVMEEWENNNDVILEAGLSIGTYLKAFHGAPVFTEDELKLFGECSEKIGLEVDSKYPKKKDLVSCGKLGEHRY
jgi:hypothetical protein